MKIAGLHVLFLWLILSGCGPDAEEVRQSIRLDEGWTSVAVGSLEEVYEGFEQPDFDDTDWVNVQIPHNWDQYHGFRRERHGNFHGHAFYRSSFEVPAGGPDSRHFLIFEGVGSYATVWVNGTKVGEHAGGRTTFTIDVTDVTQAGVPNVLAVQADHPSSIRDLPWVCGGCSPEWGFSEGSQPLGIFRPVHLLTTSGVRVEPFGVHIWNDTTVNTESATLYVNTELKNYSAQSRKVKVENRLLDARGKQVAEVAGELLLGPGEEKKLAQVMEDLRNPILWDLDNPYLYTMQTDVLEDGVLIDRVEDAYGIRWVKWDVEPVLGEGASNRFYLNGEAVFINGTAEYEHLMGRSHAFTDDMVYARTEQIRSAGFNLFRDAHQPHNLRYQERWDEMGMLWWPQMSAHIWFDNPEFRENFKARLRDFIRERRNNPSNVIWGLQNESTLPEDFARECTEIFREMDPTATVQRVVTTCNGGTGTDWNVIQNWSGTYGGNPYQYDEELSRQVFNGEYGAWRTTDLHSEGPFVQSGAHSELRMCQLMELKLRLGEQVAESSCGHIQWLFASHENPGRTQSGEGMRELDRVGPVNYKGLFTIWGEPLAPYYMYRSNYADKKEEPMVYIYGHNWPDRWIEPGVKDSIVVFSNCDEVELFNDVDGQSLGRKAHGGIGTHFLWEKTDIQYNVLRAVGYVDGREVAEDLIVLHHLPEAPGFSDLMPAEETLVTPIEGNTYLYRVNSGGGDYKDALGYTWAADVSWKNDESWGSRNWTDYFEGLPPFYASQRVSYDPVGGTREWELFQTYRYGMDKLSYRFPVADGTYDLELFFVEPWYGIGGGLNCERWRSFDVAVNDEVVVQGLDIWKEVGVNQALKKTIQVEVTGGVLVLSFPDVQSGQALISAVAISSAEGASYSAPGADGLITSFQWEGEGEKWQTAHWLKTGQPQFVDEPGGISVLPSELHGAEWLQTSGSRAKASFVSGADAWVYIALEEGDVLPSWMRGWKKSEMSRLESTYKGGTRFQIFERLHAAGERVELGAVPAGRRYTVAVNAAHEMVHPIDLRATVNYPGEEARVSGPGARLSHFNDKDCLLLDSPDGVAEIEFVVGLASTYGLHFRFMNTTDDILPVRMEILSHDGILQWGGTVEYVSSPEKWRTMRTDTHETINAGTYTLRLSTLQPGALYIDWLNVQ